MAGVLKTILDNLKSPEQAATFLGTPTKQEACPLGRYGEVDDGRRKYPDEFGGAAGENEEAVDSHLSSRGSYRSWPSSWLWF